RGMKKVLLSVCLQGAGIRFGFQELLLRYFNLQLQRIVETARQVAAQEPYEVLMFSHRPEYFDADEFTDFRNNAVRSVVFVSDIEQLLAIKRAFEVAIMCSHVATPFDQAALFEMRR